MGSGHASPPCSARVNVVSDWARHPRHKLVRQRGGYLIVADALDDEHRNLGAHLARIIETARATSSGLVEASVRNSVCEGLEASSVTSHHGIATSPG